MADKKVKINPKLLKWAWHRRQSSSGDKTTKKFSDAEIRLNKWVEGTKKPTFKELEEFAKLTYTPVGYFFLDNPPTDELPINDFRTKLGVEIKHPSIDMLDMIYICKERQDWYHDFMVGMGEVPLDFVKSIRIDEDPIKVAKKISDRLVFSVNQRSDFENNREHLKLFKERIENIGVLVEQSGTVGNQNHRSLNPDEFRGFALVDNYAPLIFVNAKDAKNGQMFTMAHELAHIWLGETGVSNSQIEPSESQKSLENPSKVEKWCNAVAAEILVPLHAFEKEYNKNHEPHKEAERLAKKFSVSEWVILRRMYDSEKLNKSIYDKCIKQLNEKLKQFNEKPKQKSGGGNYYQTTKSRLSKRFAQALIVSTLEGQTLYRDAYKMLGIKGRLNFDKLVDVVLK